MAAQGSPVPEPAERHLVAILAGDPEILCSLVRMASSRPEIELLIVRSTESALSLLRRGSPDFLIIDAEAITGNDLDLAVSLSVDGGIPVVGLRPPYVTPPSPQLRWLQVDELQGLEQHLVRDLGLGPGSGAEQPGWQDSDFGKPNQEALESALFTLYLDCERQATNLRTRAQDDQSKTGRILTTMVERVVEVSRDSGISAYSLAEVGKRAANENSALESLGAFALQGSSISIGSATAGSDPAAQVALVGLLEALLLRLNAQISSAESHAEWDKTAEILSQELRRRVAP